MNVVWGWGWGQAAWAQTPASPASCHCVTLREWQNLPCVSPGPGRALQEVVTRPEASHLVPAPRIPCACVDLPRLPAQGCLGTGWACRAQTLTLPFQRAGKSLPPARFAPCERG